MNLKRGMIVSISDNPNAVIMEISGGKTLVWSDGIYRVLEDVLYNQVSNRLDFTRERSFTTFPPFWEVSAFSDEEILKGFKKVYKENRAGFLKAVIAVESQIEDPVLLREVVENLSRSGKESYLSPVIKKELGILVDEVNSPELTKFYISSKPCYFKLGMTKITTPIGFFRYGIETSKNLDGANVLDTILKNPYAGDGFILSGRKIDFRGEDSLNVKKNNIILEGVRARIDEYGVESFEFADDEMEM